jgi:Cd(II)/Pb(II)-responsive transcriptional regulator
LKIGELAAATATGVETIRFYEREALLPAPARTAGNYRIYDDEHIDRLAFIRHCRTLDMTLDEIRVLLRFKDAPHEECGEVDRLLDAHIGHVAHRIRELKTLERDLKALRGLCGRAQAAKDCGILGELTRTAKVAPKSKAHVEHHIAGSHGRRKAARG